MGMNYPTARDEQAAYWYLKLQEPQVGATEIEAALAWQSDPENRAAFERVDAFWTAWPRQVPLGIGRVQSKRVQWKTLWQSAAAALALVAIGIWASVSWRDKPSQPLVRQYSTSVGQIRTIRLDDGTDVILGGATSIHTSFTADVRRIVMSDGEALFHVAKDASRPFIVDTPNGSAQAVGTAFNVHRGPDDTTIAVLEGTVQVDPPDWREASGIRLGAGTQVALSTDGVIGRLRQIDPSEIASWRSGRLVFVDRTLTSVIADLNRYSGKPVTLAAVDVAGVRISGNIKLDQIESWLRSLQPAFDVDLVINEHGMVLMPRTELQGVPKAAQPNRS